MPLTMPNFSFSTFANGARQFVVQDALEMIVCFCRIVFVLVDAHHDRDVFVLRRRGDDDFLRAAFQVSFGLFLRGEDARRFDDDFNAVLGPRQRAGIALGRTP